MRAYLIDPWTQTVSAVEYSGDYQEIYDFIDAKLFDCVRFSSESEDVVYVDDEGLLSDEPKAFFMINDHPQPLAGKGLVLGTNSEGASISPEHSLEEISACVRFLRVAG